MLRTVFSRTRKLALMLAALLIVLAATHPSRAMAQDQRGQVFLPAVALGAQPDVAAAGAPGSVYVMTNETTGNTVAIYRRSGGGWFKAGHAAARP